MDRSSARRPFWPARLRASAVGVLGVAAGSSALVVAGLLPIWGSRLLAPQYPKGLTLWVYGARTEGDLREINGLNHYIGMRPIDMTTVPELALWPAVVFGSGVLLALAVFQRGLLGRLALLALWLVPVGILVDIQRWLVTFGTELDPTAALRLDPFVPLVIGPSAVWNFTIWAFPGPALGLILLVALVATIGRRATPAPRRVRLAVSAIALAGLGLATVFLIPRIETPGGAASGASPSSPPRGQVNLERLLADAAIGATVVVPAGSYSVHLVLDKPLTLLADGDVVLDGGGRGTVVTISAPDVTVRGFRIANTGGQVEEAAGIRVEADRVTLEGNRIEQAYTGIAAFGARDLRLIDNEIVGSGQVSVGPEHVAVGSESPVVPAGSHAEHAAGTGPGGQGDGISLWNVERVLLRGNRIAAVRDGLYLNYVEGALIDTNDIRSSRYAIHAMFGRDVVAFGNTLRRNLTGFVFMYTEQVDVGRNVVVDHRSPGTGFGIVLKDVRGVRIAQNVVTGNRIGMQAEGTFQSADAPATVAYNRFAFNGVGVALMATTDLSFGGNAFEGNLTQVIALEAGVERRNVWSYRGVGNTWSDYRGYDLAGDGVGDVPYLSSAVAQAVLTAAPALQVYLMSPALHLLDSAQSIWASGRRPVVVDARPLTFNAAPTDAAGSQAESPAPWYVLGLGLVLPGIAAILLGRGRPVRLTRVDWAIARR